MTGDAFDAARKADEIFAHPRLATIYDALDPDRSDLEPYLAMAHDLSAGTVLDVGCGTGTLACFLAERGFEVVGVDPAQASIDVARMKPFADRVRWLCGDATALPELSVDLAVMTANVAQVFIDERYWRATLAGIRGALADGGRLMFEARDPAQRAWEDWDRQRSWKRTEVPGAGAIQSRLEVTEVALPLVSFRYTYRFESDGTELTSDSTLRFRERTEVEDALAANGFRVDEVRDAPDRPGKEFVFLATAIEVAT